MKLECVLKNNIYSTFAKYVSLNVISMMAFSFYILADTFFVANAVGANGLVALNLVLPIFSVLNSIGALLGIGGATRYSIARGAEDKERSARIFVQIFIIGLVVGSIIAIICVSFPGGIARMLGANDEVLELAKVYLISLMAFSPFFIINTILMAFIKNDGAPKLAMTAMLSSSIFNIIFDYIFMYPLGMGMLGASLATGLSPILSIVILSIHFLRGKNSFKFVKPKFHWQDIRQSLGAGFSSCLSEFSNGVIIFTFNMVILSMAGNTGVGAYSVIANLALVGVSIFNGLGQGIQPIVSANYGAGNHARVRKVWYLTIAAAVGIGLLYYLICYLLRYQLIGIFNKDKIAELTDMAAIGMVIYNLAFTVMGIGLAGSYYLASVNKPQYATLISLMRGYLLPVPLVLLLPMALKMTGVWVSIPLTELIVAVTALTIIFILNARNKKAQANKLENNLVVSNE